MPVITYIQPDGTSVEVEVPLGHSVMEGAMKSGVDGVIAECGGACSCATCHVHIAPEWISKLAPANSTEEIMLEFAEGKDEFSRLSCQIRVTEELDGLVVTVADEQ